MRVPGKAAAEQLQFISSCDPNRVLDEDGHPIRESIPAVAAERFDGGTPLIDFNFRHSRETGGGSLGLIHETEGREREQNDRHR
jgi:hypothetical protein